MRSFPLRSVWSAVAFAALLADVAPAQSFKNDNGNCFARQGEVTLGCWNNEAGSEMQPSFNRHPEALPNLRGWDYRINLPHVRFQVADLGIGGPTAIAGVIEDASEIIYDPGTSATPDPEPGHRDNSVWLFRLKQNTGFVQYKVLPSRRMAGRPENATSLNNGWRRVGPSDGVLLTPRPVSAHVIGKGYGSARIFLFMRDDEGAILTTSRRMSDADTSFWPNPWARLGVKTSAVPHTAVGFDDRVVIAWHDASTLRVHLRTVNPDTGVAGPEIQTQLASESTPRLLWDGTALNVFTKLQGRLRHSLATRPDFSDLTAPVGVAGDVRVAGDEYDAIEFNKRLHLVFNQGSTGDDRFVMYTTTLTPKGQPPRWSIPSHTRLLARRAPRIGSLYENLIVVAPDLQGIVRFSRKDPNVAGNDITGRADSDRWTQAGEAVDDMQPQPLDQLQMLSFNSDLYLTANGNSGWVVNLGRSVMKNLMTKKWGVSLQWGEIGGGERLLDKGLFAVGSETPAVGYFNQDRKLDFVVFKQSAEAGVGRAPVYVIHNNTTRELWHRFFALHGEIPAVGDFNGDGLSDIVTFTQQEQRFADGTPIGPAVVWVATSDGNKFNVSRIWHNSFSPKTERPLVGNFDGQMGDDVASFGTVPLPNTDRLAVSVALSRGNRFGPAEVWQLNLASPSEIPLAGDFDGDGDDDIVVFSQQPVKNSRGQLIGAAPVWVSLSSRTNFGPRSLWQSDFSPFGEQPAVADVNMDGKDDIVSFVRQRPGSPAGPRAVLVAFSGGASFSRAVIWSSDLFPSDVGVRDLDSRMRPFLGNITGNTLADITTEAGDSARPAVGVAILRADGSVKVSNGLLNIPHLAGAPWENYKWFTEKGVGVALFPDWLHAGPGHCLSPNFVFALLGQAGVGNDKVMHSSVRTGARAGHVLEEFGHAVCANCFQVSKDPFNLVQSIYSHRVAQGGLDSTRRPGCAEDTRFYSCRKEFPFEHYFLQLLSRYRLDGDEFRAMISNSPDRSIYNRRMGEYQWFKRNWFQGAEFKRGEPQYGGMRRDGVLCLPGECAIGPPPPPPTTRTGCLEDCRVSRDECKANGFSFQTCRSEFSRCTAGCQP